MYAREVLNPLGKLSMGFTPLHSTTINQNLSTKTNSDIQDSPSWHLSLFGAGLAWIRVIIGHWWDGTLICTVSKMRRIPDP